MSDTDLDDLHARVQGISSSHRPFVLPLLRALHELGGAAATRRAIERVRDLLAPHLTVAQLQYLEDNNRFGWTRQSLKELGLLDGSRYGVWALTDVGRRYYEAHAQDAWEIPADVPTSGDVRVQQAGTETVPVTSQQAYAIPILELLAEGARDRSDIMSALAERLEPDLLPGDRRLMSNGHVVVKFRAGWALTDLHKQGLVSNPTWGSWEITDAGRELLRREREHWKLSAYQTGASARVVIEGAVSDDGGDSAPPVAPEPSKPRFRIETWQALKSTIGPLFDALQRRLRPDLGPTPDGRPVGRNVILYGPPGTGKTHVAKLVARALTGSSDEDDDRVALVQFHPSYTYEDFIQGIKPTLNKADLRYVLEEGPFLRVAKAAAQDPDRFHVLIIDEINRGDPARIFGELLYALEYRDEPVDLPLGGQLTVPPNLVLLGTMNSVDRSVALVDYALRRRFGFIRLEPDAGVVAKVHGDPFGQTAGAVMRHFNEWLVGRLDRDHAIGHSFFINPTVEASDERAFEHIWAVDVGPLMEEYFFGDADALREARARWNAAVASARAEAREVAEDEAEAVQQEPESVG